MYYYQKHIGDYRSATAHLDLLHHGVYQYLMETCYMNEQPLPVDMAKVCRLCGARTAEEKEAVLNILEEFFTLTDAGWVNSRVEKEIAAYHANSDKNRVNGAKGGRPRKNKIENNPVGFDSVSVGLEKDANSKPNQKATINHKPITINQEPILKREDVDSENSDSRFDLSLDDVNTKLQMGGLKPITQEDLQPLLVKLQSSYGHKTQMVKNQILGKAFEWIERQQRTPLQQINTSVTKTTAHTLAEQRAAMGLNQHQGQIIDVGEPKKPLMIEEVGRA